MVKEQRPFNHPTTKAERIFGIVFILAHGAIIPELVWLFYGYVLYPAGVELSETYLNLVCYGISFILVFAFMFRFLKSSFSDIFDNLRGFFTSTALAFAAYYVMAVSISYLLVLLMGENIVNPNTEDTVALTKLDANVMKVIALLFAPIIEESLFRGALFGTIRRKSRLTAYLVSALLFSFYHLWGYFVIDFQWIDLLYLLQYLPASIALAWCYERSGTIWSPILLHVLINGLSMAIQANIS